MRLRGGERIHIAGHTGGVRERAEPDAVDPRSKGVGALDDGLNVIAVPGARCVVRGGSRVVRSFAAIGGDSINNVLGVFPWSPVGMLVVAHTSTAPEHYAYALRSTDAGFALPVGTETEANSRDNMGWATAAIGRPIAAELFEKLYIVDASRTARRNLVQAAVSGGVLLVTNPVHDLVTGGSTGSIQAYTVAAFNGVLFVSGYDSEVGGLEPAMVRHSFLGRDPGATDGFSPDGYALLGAKGVFVTGLCPGNSILLVAKEHELYRISGNPKAVDGWHFAISQLDNTLGLGVSNPAALCHAAGWFYGVGRGGPWRSDGASVEQLLPGRERSWSLVQTLELSYVRWHPDRRRVVFGLCYVGDSAPRRLWKWDVDRQQWDADDAYVTQFHQVHAVDTTTGLGSAAPSGIAQSLAFADHRATKLTGTFTVGNVTAKTEVWLRHNSLSSVQVATLDEGLARFTIDAVALGIDLKYEVVQIKLRHVKAGVYSSFSGETDFYPRLRPPVLKVTRVVSGADAYRTITATNPALNSQVQNLYGDETGPGAAWTKDWLNAADGDNTDNTVTMNPAAEQQERTYAVSMEQITLLGDPTSGDVSVVLGPLLSGFATPRGASQDFAKDLETDKLHLLWFPNGWHTVDQVIDAQYRVTGSGSGWTSVAAIHTIAATGGSAPPTRDTVRLTISGLASGTKYDVRMVNNTPSSGGPFNGNETVMYTKLSAPGITLVQGGLPTPDVDITITVDAVNNGRNVRVYSASNTAGTPGYSVLHVALPTGATIVTSTAGTCGVRDKYYGKTVDLTWPTDWQFSDAATAEIASPCS